MMVTAANGDMTLVLNEIKWLLLTRKSPMVAMTTGRTSFMIVVITWNTAACLIPITVIQITRQISMAATDRGSESC